MIVWVALSLGLVLATLIFACALVRPDYAKYPDGLWPSR